MNKETIFNYLIEMGRHDASDLYLTVGTPPQVRNSKGFIALNDQPVVPDDINAIVQTLLSPKQLVEFEKDLEANTSLDMGEHGRFRINVMRQRQHTALVVRRIVTDIPSL